MSLDAKARQYAQTLYLAKQAELSKEHVKQITEIRYDFIRRGMERSGPYFAAAAREGMRYVEALANALVDSRLKACEQSHVPIDDQAVADIVRESSAVCDSQGRNVAQSIRQQIAQAGGPGGAADAVAAQVEHAMSGVKSAITRRVSILKHEQEMAAKEAPSPESQPAPTANPKNSSLTSQRPPRMSRGTKLGYGFLLVGVGLPFLIDKLFGSSTALVVVAASCVVVGICFLIAGHLSERTRLARTVILALLAVIMVGTGIEWRIHRDRHSSTRREPTTGAPSHNASGCPVAKGPLTKPLLSKPPRATQKRSATLPSGYQQTFDDGPCDPPKRPDLDPNRGPFANLQNADRRCLTTPDGNPVTAVMFRANNWSAASVSGVTPAQTGRRRMRVTLRWVTESSVNLIDKAVDWNILRSCNSGDMQMVLRGAFNISQPPNFENYSTVNIDSCKAGDRYSLEIIRDGENDHLPALMYLDEVQVDFR